MRRPRVDLCLFQDAKGRQPFAGWFDRPGDRVVQARVMQRLDRLQAGNPGDCRALGSSLMELRIDIGPGYRIYFARIPVDRCLILCGGSKRTQVADIERARKWLEETRRWQGR
jgi:putative addiction module killer protein